MENSTLFNITICSTLELDLSEKSRTISSNRHVLLAISATSSVIDVFIVISSVTLFVALIKSSYDNEGKVAMTSSNISQRSRLLMASVSACHTVVGAFLVPAAVTQMIHNGAWVLGPQACTAKNVLEAVITASCMYHVIFMALDMYLAICRPLAYRMLTARSSHLMIWSSWILPLAIFLAPMLFGWHQQGKELVILCQTLYGICSTVFNNYVLIFIVFFLTILPFIVLIIMYALILRAIAKFHGRLSTEKSRRLKMNLQRRSSIHFDSRVSGGITEVSDVAFSQEKDIAALRKNDQLNNGVSTVCDTKKKTPSDSTSAVNRNGKMFDRKQNQSPLSRGPGSSFGNFRKSCRNARAFRYILGILSWYAVLCISFFISKLVTVYRPDLMPKWLGTAMWWMGYLNSVVNPLLLCSNTNVRHCVETLIGVKFYRN